jgi:N4-gp56 family major capsid protein
MAVTSIATTHGLSQTQWEAGLYSKYQEQTFWGKFKGTDENSPVQVKRELGKSAGDGIVFGLAGTLSGSGVTGNNPLTYTALEGVGSGNEEAMTFYDQKVVIDQIRNGVRIAGEMDKQRVAFDTRNQAKMQLTDWMARDEDASIFTAVNTADVIANATLAPTVDTKLDLDFIVGMKKEAMFPSGATKKLRPISLKGGEEVFIVGVNPSDAVNLKTSSDYKTINTGADDRGSENKLFTGAIGYWNGCIIHEHSGFAAGAPVIIGAQAAFLAYSKEVIYGEENFDHGNQNSFMIGSIRGVELAVFNDGVTNAGSHGALRFDLSVA